MDITLFITLFIITSVITFTVLYIWSIIWSYKDANSRGKNGLIVAILVALFAWPFSFLFWHVIRPETVRVKAKPKKSKNSQISTNKYMSSFKKMPSLLKIFLLINIYASVTALFKLIQMEPVQFEYFGSGFPRNYPAVWHLHYLVFSMTSIFVYLKRSYSLLIKYLYVTIGILFISIMNSVYFVNNLPADQRITTTYMYIFVYVIGGLIPYYLFKQKKYFNEV